VHTLQEIYITKFDELDETLQKSLEESLKIWAPGIQSFFTPAKFYFKVISVRVTKPRIPQHIANSYESREAEKIKLMISTEK